ncbi:MAG: hypothetical protein LUI02_07490 [Clostridiales bacterium]|nr:hypothetical protein [Clostridiales bacterium]
MVHLNWESFFLNVFGTLKGWGGINVGFWVAMIVVALVVLIENIVFWCMKPRPEAEAIAAQYKDHYFDRDEDEEDD